MKLYAFKSDFSDGRDNFTDLVLAASTRDAEEKALTIVRGIDAKGYGCDERAEVDILDTIATAPGSVAAEITEAGL